ncbi:hypothetical protein EDD29_6623 [Actinocorallia herbida]|uniref:Uncharacterized protein n=1 Tax=Actinocorallia herbida TaxID=58109 RepID=A0A3N1D755_9ACTN|nr:hypothetical protein [Actinocorallia herbida]ROO88938.1 hypothetical protein EDD29_6623 [Actinocorallia herbida]
MPDFGADRRYRELVRLSYLVLPGGRANEVRLALARRIVERALPRRPIGGSAYAEARRAVLRQSMRPPRRLRWRLVPWLRGLPAQMPDNPALAALRPEERVAYVLCRVVGMRRYAARDVLVDLAVPNAHDLLERVAEMPELNVVTPGPVGARNSRRSKAPLAVALLVTCAAGGALAVEEGGFLNAQAGAHHASAPTGTASTVKTPVQAATPTPEERLLWEGTLPGRGGRGKLICHVVTDPQGTIHHEGLLAVEGRSHKARDCTDGRTGLWWRAPNRHWYYLAAGRGVALEGARQRAGLSYVKGERAKHAPQRAVSLD